jgi:hypothetical protein
MTSMEESQRRLRSERRAFIRTHHPDFGGDPAAFRAGLQHLDATLSETPPRVLIMAAPPWALRPLTSLIRRLQRRRQPSRVR